MNNLARSNEPRLSKESTKILNAYRGTHVSKNGYEFDFWSDKWQVSGNETLLFKNIEIHDHDFELGFRAALSRYAEEYSDKHTVNMFYATRGYLKKTGATSLTVKGISEFKSQLSSTDEYRLGAVKGFWLQWFDWGLPGIDEDAVALLDELTLTGNTKGAAVAKGCPYTGPLTELEQSALLEWSTNALQRGDISITIYTYFLSLMFTGRRGVQIRSLRVSDLFMSETSKGSNYELKIPRAKQRGVGFREEFRTLPITDELYMALKCLIGESKSRIEKRLRHKLHESQNKKLPIFIQWDRLMACSNFDEIEVLLKNKPDYLHMTRSEADDMLRTFRKKCQAKSERIGDFINLSSRRFRYTKGTNLARRGISGIVLAESLDQSDTQNIGVYTENTPRNAEIIDEIMTKALAPLAQAFAGMLIDSERDALRANDPNSRVRNGRSHGVGSCGTHGFCASGYRACYTCDEFQAWRDAPHHEVLEDLLREREEQKEDGVSASVIQATDRLLLAVQRVIQLCAQRKAEAAAQEGV